MAAAIMGKVPRNQKSIQSLFLQPCKQPEMGSHFEIQLPANPSVIQIEQPSTIPSVVFRTSQEEDARQNVEPNVTAPSAHATPILATSTMINSMESDTSEDKRKRRRTESPVGNSTFMGVAAEDLSKVRRSGREASKGKIYSFAPDIGDSRGKQNLPPAPGKPVSKDVSMNTKKDKLRVKLPSGITASGDSMVQATNTSSIPTTDVLSSTTTNVPTRDRPKKLLLFNPKTGTIGSPPAKKHGPASEKQADSKQKKSQIVVFSYDSYSQELGDKIEHILRTAPQPRRITPKKKNKRSIIKDTPPKKIPLKIAKSPPKPGKPLHPLFKGKTVPGETQSALPKPAPNTHIVVLTTPKRPVQSQPSVGRHQGSSGFAGFGTLSKTTRLPGALHPAWPWKGMVHVRGLQGETGRESFMESCIAGDRSKSKFRQTTVSPEEDVLQLLVEGLDIKQVYDCIQRFDLDSWTTASCALRMPTKHIESGRRLQQRIRKQLRCFRPSDGSTEDELQAHESTPPVTNAALHRIYDSIASTMSAYDIGQGESQTWTQKYAPKSASDVLQAGREAVVLKEWLQSLTVKSVEGSILGKPQGSSKSRVGETTKRKRKPKGDDFIVSDDELDDLDEISEPEDTNSFKPSSLGQKSVVRSGGRDIKLKNALLISGPTGCGKSAAVYAVAKELGFEVFELNSSSRRSGKDIMEKVGDMTRNHLVQRQHKESLPDETPSASFDEDIERSDQALADDISSGRQGTMISFFKVKNPSTAKSKPKATPKEQQPPNHDKTKRNLRDVPLFKPSKQEQKQSLILIEEIDILYEEDKNFWTTVLSLIVSSKRPLIMTCNDESAIQADLEDHLHAILRFAPPPLLLATDYLLLIAAGEGHALEHSAVKDLYESRKFDLRASISELNFWCQFAVGDQKHGGDWYFRRENGKDMDETGHPLRVVSEGSFSNGLEWISADALTSKSSPTTIDEEVLTELWDRFQVDALDLHPDSSFPHPMASNSTTTNRSASTLQQYEEFTETLSVSDLISGTTFSTEKETDFDPSHPLLPIKALDDFPTGRKILQAPNAVHYHPLEKHLSFSLRARAGHLLESEAISSQRSSCHLNGLILSHVNKPNSALTRYDLCLAFDPISFPTTTPSLSNNLAGATALEPSVFDRTITLITTDIAPYVRGIISYESRLQQLRLERSGVLLSQDGGRTKKARMTRSAMSALEGGARSSVRREKWFDADLNATWVMKTGGEWSKATVEEEGRRREQAIKAIQAAQEARAADIVAEVSDDKKEIELESD